jgi:hypothetical protein
MPTAIPRPKKPNIVRACDWCGQPMLLRAKACGRVRHDNCGKERDRALARQRTAARTAVLAEQGKMPVKHCQVCWDLPWRRAETGCAGCDEPRCLEDRPELRRGEQRVEIAWPRSSAFRGD